MEKTLTSSPTNSLIQTGNYAVRKRILLPRWWLESLLMRHGATAQHQQRIKNSAFYILGPAFQTKLFFLLSSIWNSLVLKSLQEPEKNFSVRIPIGHFLRGTPSECSILADQLEEYWVSTFNIQLPSSAGANLSARKKSSGTVSLVQYARVERKNDPELVLDFLLPLADLVAGRFEHAVPPSLRSNDNLINALNVHQSHLCGVNPDIIRVYARGTTFKKICHYIQIELARSYSTIQCADEGWYGNQAETQQLIALHKENLAHTASLYDHGVLGWNLNAPQIRLSQVRENSAARSGGVWHCWRVSDSLLQSTDVEASLSRQLGALRPSAPRTVPLRLARHSPDENEAKIHLKINQKHEPKIESKIETKIETKIEPAQNIPKIKTQTSFKPLDENPFSIQDDQFRTQVSLFLKSLTPVQKQALEREQRNMSEEEFRNYLAPVLKMIFAK